MSNYALISEEDRQKYAPELAGQGHIIVTDGEKMWIVKQKIGPSDPEKRDLLGYLLGRQFANVAEVKLLDQQEHEQIKILTNKEENSTSNNTFLIRLCGTYSIDELPRKTLEEAVAAELIYSIWIRRRDTHVDNRVYIKGIPIFYDHEVAFLHELDMANSANFFTIPGGYGHPHMWRVKEIQETITTVKARSVNRQTNGADHYVMSIEEFKRQLDIMETKLVENLTINGNWKDIIYTVGFTKAQADDIYSFLQNNLNNLDQDIKIMEGIIYNN